MSAKKDVLKMIDKRAKRIVELRQKSHKTKTATELVLKFLEEVESIYDVATSANEFYTMIDIITKGLDQQMRILDLLVRMEVDWNNAADWRDLRVIGIKIQWSKYYQDRHQVPPEQYIDIMALLVENFDESL